MYSITVRIEGIESRRRSAGLLHIVLGLFLIAKAANYYQIINYRNFFPVVPPLLIGSFSLFYGIFRKKIDLTYQYNHVLRLLEVLAFAMLGIMMVEVGRPIDYIGVFVFAFLSVLLMLSEKRIFQETTIYLNEDGIRIPGYYKDHLVTWNELSSVVVREDFLTLFHVKQKYLQYQVLQDLSTLEIAKMNAFCKEQIEHAATAAATKN